MNMKFKVFLINLDKSQDRLEVCQQHLERYNIEFERVSAVYGKDLTQQQIDQFYDSKRNQKGYKKDLNLGELGCYLSHIKCWQKIVDEQLDYALILEDDFKLSDSFGQFEHIFEKLTEWDFVRIAYPIKPTATTERLKITEQHDLVFYKKVPINTLAQAVSFRGAERLLAASKQIFRPIDVDIKHYWEKGIDVLAIDPPLVNAHQDFSSEIDKLSATETRKGNTKFWRQIRYISGYKLKSKYYGLFRPKLQRFLKDKYQKTI